MDQVERRQWWLWASAIVVTLLLTLGIFSFTFPLLLGQSNPFYIFNLNLSIRGLIGVVLLFDIYSIYQQLQIHRVRRQLQESEKLFHLIGENAADLIAVVDAKGNRLYNSPSYEKILGYSLEELKNSSGLDQIHPDDRAKVVAANDETKRTGVGRRLEYRMRHKNGAWRFLESTASAVQNASGETEKLVIVNSRQQVLQPRILDLNSVVADLAKMLRRLIGADKIGRAHV